MLPAYRNLPKGELQRRADAAVALLQDCRACPRECGVNRLEDRWSVCRTGRHAVVSSFGPHLGEEPCLRGTCGSGTIFFGHCNLGCVFCQNHDISQELGPGPETRTVPSHRIAGIMLALQQAGCHNINLVTPEHVVPQVLEAVAFAAERGLRLPVVYNTGSYDSPETLALLDGVVDIYMPDFKFWREDSSGAYLKAADYRETACAAIREMHRQVGPLQMDGEGLAVRGVLVRHLVMPGFGEETVAILNWLANELGPGTYLNLMDQYRPAHRVSGDRYPELNRHLSAAEFREAVLAARSLGFRLDSDGPSASV